MVKKSSVFTSILLGAAGGAAAAVFLASKSGKAVKERVIHFAKDYQENHDDINAEILHKAQDMKQQAVDKYQEVKEQFESGELTAEDLVQSGKEKAQVVKNQSVEKFEQLKDKISEQNVTPADILAAFKGKTATKDAKDVTPATDEEIVVVDDIEIDLTETIINQETTEE